MKKLIPELLRHKSKVVDWMSFQIRLVRVGAKRGNPLFVGIGSTKLFLAVIVLLALLPQQKDGKWSWRVWSFVTGPSNEIGDTLAGIAGALAFLWIIVTVMLQSQELREQRRELRRSRIESEKMAKAMNAQAKVFKTEQKQRLEDRADLLQEQQLRSLLSKVNLLRSLVFCVVEKPKEIGAWNQSHLRPIEQSKAARFYLFPEVSTSSTDASCEHLERIMAKVSQTIAIASVKSGQISSVDGIEFFEKIENSVASLMEQTENLSPMGLERFYRLRIPFLWSSLKDLELAFERIEGESN